MKFARNLTPRAYYHSQKKYKINSSSKNINLEVKRLKIIEQITSQTQKHDFKKDLVEARDKKTPNRYPGNSN